MHTAFFVIVDTVYLSYMFEYGMPYLHRVIHSSSLPQEMIYTDHPGPLLPGETTFEVTQTRCEVHH